MRKLDRKFGIKESSSTREIDEPVATPRSIDHSKPLQPEALPGEPEFESTTRLDTMTRAQKYWLLFRDRRNQGLLQAVAKTLWLPEKNISQVYWGRDTSALITAEIEKELGRRMGTDSEEDAS